LPDAVFARALASSMCRALKVEAAPVLERLPLTAVPRLQPVQEGINTPFHAPGESAHNSVWDRLSKPVVLAVLALMAAALVMILFPSIKASEEVKAVVSDAKVPEAAAVPMIVPIETVGSKTLTEVPVSITLAVPQPVTSSPVVSVTPSGQIQYSVELPSSTSPVPSVSASAAMPVQGNGATDGLVVLKARGSSWVEVTDGKGVVQIRKTLTAGEVVGVSGPLPLSVVVGRVDSTDVQVRGKAFDLTRIVRDNVARFEVK
jgi:cytoskeleton protein RodZ